MQYKSTKSTVDQVMLKYVNSFVKAMNERNENAIHNIALSDFIEVGR